jgi:hypothetical protein
LPTRVLTVESAEMAQPHLHQTIEPLQREKNGK